MHATRIATFLLGAWIGCCLLVGALAFENVTLTDRLLNAPLPQADEVIKNAGPSEARLLLHHFAAEEYRMYLADWGLVQIGFAILTTAFVYFAVDRRLLPVIMCGLMLVLVLFQYFAIAPELAFRGRESDFPPASLAVGAATRRRAMMEVYGGAEAVKLLIGGILASYIFSFKSRRRVRPADEHLEVGRAGSLRD